MLIDSHCHLDASVFKKHRTQIIQSAQSAGVRAIVIPAVDIITLARSVMLPINLMAVSMLWVFILCMCIVVISRI